MSNLTQREVFRNVYLQEVLQAAQSNPQMYVWFNPHASEAEQIQAATKIADKVTYSLSQGTGSKDGIAVKATCKKLNIPLTYKAIQAYLKGE